MFEIIPFTRRNNNTSVYDPFEAFNEMEKRFWGDSTASILKTDIKDNGDSYELIADLPGFNKEDIKVDLDDDRLTISATRHSEAEEKKGSNYIRIERSYGTYSRSFDVSGINTDEIGAKYENGVLTLTLPKQSEKVETSRSIEIG